MRYVCFSIVTILQPRLIRIPTGDTLRMVVNEFEARCNFPQVAGAIDGSHIPIVRPHKYHVDYFNRKHFYSIVLQAVVDYRYCFWDINVGWPGSCRDDGKLANSDLFKKAQYGNLCPVLNIIIDNAQVPIMLLGDPAYPLMPWPLSRYGFMKHLTRERLHFKILETTKMISTRKPNNAFILNDSSRCEVTVLGEESDDHHTHSMYTRCVEGWQYIY